LLKDFPRHPIHIGFLKIPRLLSRTSENPIPDFLFCRAAVFANFAKPRFTLGGLAGRRSTGSLMSMQRRPHLRRRINAGAAALEARGLRPCAMDLLPTGTIRFHLIAPGATEESGPDDLDRELADFEARHGQG
jgi:hypothetical protein